jgi:hypothetical protein
MIRLFLKHICSLAHIEQGACVRDDLRQLVTRLRRGLRERAHGLVCRLRERPAFVQKQLTHHSGAECGPGANGCPRMDTSEHGVKPGDCLDGSAQNTPAGRCGTQPWNRVRQHPTHRISATIDVFGGWAKIAYYIRIVKLMYFDRLLDVTPLRRRSSGLPQSGKRQPFAGKWAIAAHTRSTAPIASRMTRCEKRQHRPVIRSGLVNHRPGALAHQSDNLVRSPRRSP